MSGEVFIVGVGMTPFGRWPDRPLKSLVAEAVRAALKDAGTDVSTIGAAYFANSTQGHLDGQHMIRGQIALRPLGIEGIPVINVENACAGGSTAFALAVNHVRAGGCDIALAVGAEKMISPDRERMMSVFDSGWEIADSEANRAKLTALGEGIEAPEGTTSPKPYSVFMDVYAAFARQHMRQFGSTQMQFASVAAKNHGHSVHNPLAQFRDPFSVAQVLAAAPITYPLTLPMCSPISDGAAAVIVASRQGLRRLGIVEDRGIRVLASVIQTGSTRDPLASDKHLTALAAQRAYGEAGLGPNDVSVAEVHDATAVGEVIQTENLGFCAFGEGGALAERGDTAIGGRIPVNPSGGLESKGHPIAATGLGQLHELVLQLRGQAGKRQVGGARVALAENGGGLFGIEEAVACITILGR
ncbi:MULTISPECIES: thiolase family protein [Sphingomonadaceae]|nr:MULTISPECIES: thiolase family protein [Sphingomonadaceae]BBF72377.1 thiolase [Sphingomonas bisphenolicum]|tara:strand:+ start:2923 stop:4164 length:1242 start_codon:yes stop_codon:yes gene_type:complete